MYIYPADRKNVFSAYTNFPQTTPQSFKRIRQIPADMAALVLFRYDEDLLASGKGLANSTEEGNRPAAGAAGN